MSGHERPAGRVDQGRLVKIIGGFARRATGDFSLDSLLHDLATAVAEVLNIDGVGVSYHDGEQMRVVHALPPSLSHVERIQEVDQTGPCHDAVEMGAPVMEGDLAHHSYRWPRFAEEALSEGLHAVAAIPLLGRDRAWGAMDLYRREPGPFGSEELAAAQVLADVACGYVVMAHDRSQAEQSQKQAAHAATHDALTGLPNRALLYDRLQHAVATTSRGGRAVAVVFIDLDGFKVINDTHGHHAGDELLRQVADRFAGVVRQGDTLARWGGDEFVVICETVVSTVSRHSEVPTRDLLSASHQGFDEHALDVIVDRLHAALHDPFDLPPVVHVQASIGVSAGVPSNAPGTSRSDGEALLRLADDAMYRAKREPHRGPSRRQRVINLPAEQDRAADHPSS